ncbi:MAG: flagellar export chaperone FliS [Syntrophorhabdales bacterium]|jgi:flagellar biosynthetic protein FliS
MNPYEAYATANMMTDEHDKGKVLLKVLRTLAERIEDVKVLIAEKKYERKYVELTRTIQVLRILHASLDMSLGEIPRNLSLLYEYLMRRLQEVHASLDLAALDECKAILTTLSEGFAEAYRAEKKKASFAVGAEKQPTGMSV